MADSNFVVKNGLVVNGSFIANSTAVNAAAITATTITVGSVSINSSTINVGSVSINSSGGLNINSVSGNLFTVGTASYFVSNGNLGIGTASPTAKLEVSGAATVSGILTGGSLVSSSNTTTIGTTAYFVSNGKIGIGTSSPTTQLDVYNSANSSLLVVGDSNTTIISSRASTDAIGPNINFRKYRGTQASPTTVASSDQVGSSNYTAYDGTALRTVSQIAGTVETYTTTDNVSGYLSLLTRPTGLSATLAERIRISANGNVGISNTAPNATLAVTGTANVSGNTIIGGLLSSANVTTTTNVATIGTALYVVSNGNIGISNSSPDAKLTITGAANVSGAVVIGGTLASTNTVTFGTAAYFVANGNLGIGNSSPTSKLHVQGAILASDNITAYSDERLKENISTIDDALILIKKIRGVRYDSKETGIKGIGVVAQEVQPFIPEVVMQNGEYLSVAYGNMVGLLVEAVKELSSEVEMLRSEIDQLKGD